MSKACGYPFKHTRISHRNAVFDGLLGSRASDYYAPVESGWLKMLFYANGDSQDVVATRRLVNPDPSPGGGIELRS